MPSQSPTDEQEQHEKDDHGQDDRTPGVQAALAKKWSWILTPWLLTWWRSRIAWEQATRLGTVREAPGGDPVVRLEAGAIEIFGGWLGRDTRAIIERAEVIDGVPFARLEDVLAFKRSYGHPKDLEHARIIERHLGIAPDSPSS